MRLSIAYGNSLNKRRKEGTREGGLDSLTRYESMFIIKIGS